MLDARAGFSSEGASRNVSTVGWGLLLIWIGAAMLLHCGWGVGVLGAGLIVLGAQLARWYLHLEKEGLSIVAGLVMLILGLGDLSKVAVDLLPVLLIVAGIALLVSIWASRRRHAAGALPDVEAHAQPRG